MNKDGEGSATEWVFARADKTVYGIGDEARVLRNGMTADEHAKLTLTKEEKTARLKKLRHGARALTAAEGSSRLGSRRCRAARRGPGGAVRSLRAEDDVVAERPSRRGRSPRRP